MEILYKQTKETAVPFDALSITQCYCKHLCIERDARNITVKSHHHTGFEVHIIENGHQQYEIGGDLLTVRRNEFLLIPPQTSHRIVSSAPHTTKCSLIFNVGDQRLTERVNDCCIAAVSDRLRDNIAFIAAESKRRYELSERLIASAVFESIVLIMRDSGMKEEAVTANEEVDPRCLIAKQYIHDNVEQALCVGDVAHYCHLSEKQLSRLFFAAEGVSVAAYIRTRRVEHLEELLNDRRLSLRDIAERMDFSSEHYLSAFFKKNGGMTPGAFRRMLP